MQSQLYGDAATTIGTLSEAHGTGSTAIGINSLTKGVANSVSASWHVAGNKFSYSWYTGWCLW